MFLLRRRKPEGRDASSAAGGRKVADLQKEVERANMLNKQLQEQVSDNTGR